MAGEAGLVRTAWPPLEEEAHFMKAMRMGVPPVGHSCPSRVPSQLHSRTSSGSGKKKFGARHENTGGEKAQGRPWLGGPGSSTEEKLESLHSFVLLARVQRSNLLQCLGSVSKAPDSTPHQTQPLRGLGRGNERLMRKLARDVFSECL